MKYLILGSAGQIGSALKNYLINCGHTVLSIDIVESLEQDLRLYNNNLLDSYMQECDFVMFLAFDVGGSRYLEKYQHTYEFIENNTKIICNTFESICKYNKPFFFASSQMSNMSHSPYGVLKALGEHYTKALNGITVKFWNVYGQEHDLEKAHVITDFILSAKNNGKINMLTSGSEVRQFLHADDCSRCLHILSEQYATLPRNKEYHITSFIWTSILDVAHFVQQCFLGTEVIPGVASDTVQFNKMNEPDQHILSYWQPKIKIEQGIKDVIEKMKL